MRLFVYAAIAVIVAAIPAAAICVALGLGPPFPFLLGFLFGGPAGLVAVDLAERHSA